MKQTKLEMGKVYYNVMLYMGRCGVWSYLYRNDAVDKRMIRIGNCFRKKKDAEAMKVKVLKVLKG